jgi:dihydroorotase
MQIRISGGRLIDPGHYDGIGDIIIEDGKIAGLVEHRPDILRDGASNIQHAGFRIIDARNKIVTPGLIDMHVHLRQPGQEHKETIETGCRAAAWGGFCAVCCMPNTSPVNDSQSVTEHILRESSQVGLARVYPVAAISKGLAGESLADFDALKNAGGIGVSDDGNPVMNSRLMRQALEKARDLELTVISHCEDLNLASDGVMNEGSVAGKLGYAGIPNSSETIMVLRDIALSESSEAAVHIAHVSTRESVRAIRQAKSRGVRVTAETAPHYFTLTDQAVAECGTNAKMNPPLRSQKDCDAVCEGLADGTIDAIVTDHAPHSVKEKALPFADAPNGIIGLETSLSLSLTLVKNRVLSFEQLVEKMSHNPARILGLKCGLRVGNPADMTIIDPELSYTVEAENFQSKSRNTPYDGWLLTGKPVLTMVDGRVIFDGGR